MEDLASKIDNYSDEYLAIKRQAKKYLRNNSAIDDNNTLNIFHRPWVAPFNWGLNLYKGADKQWLEQFEQETKKIIPTFYKTFLLAINGCFVYDLSLFGLPPSLYLNQTLDRSQLQCHDLGSANTNWIYEYRVDKNSFHFGNRAYTHDENLGYFFYDNKIKSIITNGRTVSQWDNYSDFLNDEINEAERMMLKEVPKQIKILTNE
jgi:hypothetical protein